MSRNPDYEFVSTDAGEIVSMLTEAYEKITKTTVHPASPERLFIQWASGIIIHERVLNNYTGNQNIPSRAVGKIWMHWQNLCWSRSVQPQKRRYAP